MAKDETWIVVKKKVKPNKPVLVVGLPGIGSVGSLVVHHLKNEFNATRFATLYSDHFPPRVTMLKNGTIRMPSNRFYLLKNKKSGHDIVLLLGDDQAASVEGMYAVNQKIVEFFKNTLKGEFIYTIGGYGASEPITGAPKVFGNASSKKVIERFGKTDILFGKSRGMILGAAGMIIGFAKMNGVPAVCLMGETAFVGLDAAAAKAVLTILGTQLNLPIDTKNLDKIINKTANALKEFEQQMMQQLQMPQLGQQPVAPDQNPSYIR